MTLAGIRALPLLVRKLGASYLIPLYPISSPVNEWLIPNEISRDIFKGGTWVGLKDSGFTDYELKTLKGKRKELTFRAPTTYPVPGSLPSILCTLLQFIPPALHLWKKMILKVKWLSAQTGLQGTRRMSCVQPKWSLWGEKHKVVGEGSKVGFVREVGKGVGQVAVGLLRNLMARVSGFTHTWQKTWN